MTVYSGLFNSINGDRRYDATWFARYFATFIGNGVFPNPGNGLQVVEDVNLTTIVKPGDGWIKGYFIVNDSDYKITHDVADGVLNRIDRVVLQLDYVARVINIVNKKGTPASTPTAPSVQRDADKYELVLADVYINAGTTEIIQARITDRRLDTSLCGIVHGLVNQVDTSTLYNQYQSWINEQKLIYESDLTLWTEQSKQDFQDWFVTVQDILDTNVAGNLLLLIQQNQSDIRALSKIKTNITIPVSGWTLNTGTDYYEYVISDTDIDDTCMVDVNFHLDSIEYATYVSSACVSITNGVKLFASDTIDVDLVLDYRITRQVI